MAKKKTKPTLEATVESLAQIAEKHLAGMPQEEQQERIAALSRRTFTPRRDKPSMPSKTVRKPASRATARGR